jgi:hypothetical protein
MVVSGEGGGWSTSLCSDASVSIGGHGGDADGGGELLLRRGPGAENSIADF